MTYAEIAAIAAASGDWAGRNLSKATVAYHLEMLSHDMGRMKFDQGTRDCLYIDHTERAILFAIFGAIATQSAEAEPAPASPVSPGEVI